MKNICKKILAVALIASYVIPKPLDVMAVSTNNQLNNTNTYTVSETSKKPNKSKKLVWSLGIGFAEAMKNVKKDMEKAISTDFGNDLNMSIDSADSLVSMSSDKPDLYIKNNGIFGKLDSILSLFEYYIPDFKIVRFV